MKDEECKGKAPVRVKSDKGSPPYVTLCCKGRDRRKEEWEDRGGNGGGAERESEREKGSGAYSLH
jgi:hypothetical protein